jgi:dipeptidyl aminopeptidase/acylaminoacyl peptidase
MSLTTAYGSWKSPITSDLIVSETIGLGQIAVDGSAIYWLELRPAEAGRNVLVRCSLDGKLTDLTPAPFNVRSRVHEYGGGAFAVAEGTVYFVNFADQNLYCQTGDAAPTQLTDTPSRRYADGLVDSFHQQLIWVEEDHQAGEHKVSNRLIRIGQEGTTQVLAAGQDFYASPCLSPDGQWLAWLTWNQPQMPWDGTELWLAPLQPDGSLGQAERVTGGTEESIFQPRWSTQGELWFVSDRSNWWNLYRRTAAGQIASVMPMAAEFGLPQWVFGQSTYAFVGSDHLVCTYNQAGIWHLASLELSTQTWQELATPYTEISNLQATADGVVFQGSSATLPAAIATLNLTTGKIQILRSSTQVSLAAGYLSQPQAIAFPTSDGSTAYGLYYPPQNQDCAAPDEERPPLLVKSHGGPTAATSSSFNLSIQYWTSRGFAFLDVNYRGSTGYGRAYRQQLRGQWGIADVEDCINGAKHLVEQGLADGDRLAIRGSSAGGYTTLAALTFHNTFKAGASYYGVSDMEALAKDTHKFEARYLDLLVGPYPEQQEIYWQRSPINFAEQLTCPVIFFQGLEDQVVPPNQAEKMVEILVKKGLPVAYVAFAGEQHGFRQAANIKRALEAELYFYSQIFAFPLAEAIEPVIIQGRE